jgi:hypothetical protein
VINGALNIYGPGFSSMRVRLNDVDEPLNMTRRQIEQQAFLNFGSAGLSSGSAFWGGYIHDIWYAEKIVAGGDARDAYDTEKFSTFELILNIDSGTTLGTNSYVSICREIIQYPRRTA